MRSIPQSIQDKINKQNQTVFDNADHKMQVTIARAKNTVIDSSYWVVNTIREKPGLGDVSVAPRRQKVTGAPNRIYEIHVDNGIVGTSFREYPDHLKDGFLDQFTLGAGSSVAIAFDGEWFLYRTLWRLVTHEKPWIFWVDNSNKLWAQLWDDPSTKQELAQNVKYCRAIRAWKNLNMADKDQGIVVGYIKTDGSVYYRNHCQRLDLSYVWENERQITEFTGAADSLNLFITNDYRMGFVVSDTSNNIFWYITDRDWAGMAVAPEFIQSSISGCIELIEIEKKNSYSSDEYIQTSINSYLNYLYAMPDNKITFLENVANIMTDENQQQYQNYGFKIYLKLDHDLTSVDYADFNLKDSNNIPFAVTGIEKVSNKQYFLSTADFNNANGNLLLSFTGNGNTKGEAGQDLDSFDSSFLPSDLVPTFIALPEVEVIFNE